MRRGAPKRDNIHLTNIYKKVPDINAEVLQTENNVGIIPNKQCFRHGGEESIIDIYREIINLLLKLGKNVYIFRHSYEDLAYCEKIAEGFDNNSQVRLLKDDMSCIEYDEFVKQFDFIICSRFHGIVHAYKNYIPVIALGWAVKYRELTDQVGQSGYIYDITDNKCDINKILSSVKTMSDNVDKERAIIREKVNEIQKYNCFDAISEWVNNNYE